jgi:diadenosine tetraphosphate (Ap4A) HIT family hydrolase
MISVSPAAKQHSQKWRISNFPDERTALWAMVDEAKELLDSRFSPDGYNIGINVGAPAGQIVLHCHIHLIPRRSADSVNPRGGVRGVISGKADYSRNG